MRLIDADALYIFFLEMHQEGNTCDPQDVLTAITNAPTIEADSGEKQRADSWVEAVRDLARELGIADEDSNGSIHDWKHIKRIALKNEADSGEAVYEYRHIGDSDWQPCSKKWFDYANKSPEFDARIIETSPQKQWVDLTDKQIQYCVEQYPFSVHGFAEAIQAKLKEVNHG